MDRAEGGAGGGFSAPPPLFCKNKVNSTKNNLTKITEPKIAPTPPPSQAQKLAARFLYQQSLGEKYFIELTEPFVRVYKALLSKYSRSWKKYRKLCNSLRALKPFAYFSKLLSCLDD